MSKTENKISLEEAKYIASLIEAEICDQMQFCKIAGSIRRKRESIGDIEFVVLPKNLESFLVWCDTRGFTGGQRIRKGHFNGVKVEFYIAPDKNCIGSMLFMYTGDAVFNMVMRGRAKKMGLKLNQYGLWGYPETCLASKTEQEMFNALGVGWHDPTERSYKDR